MSLKQLYTELEQQHGTTNSARFFKTKAGDYGAQDQFAGIPVPRLRLYARQYSTLTLEEIRDLLYHPINEYRLLALILLTENYKRTREARYAEFYLEHIDQVNNWNLVDSSCYLILGPHWEQQPEKFSILAGSERLWHRRIAVVSTLHFIRKNIYEPTLTISSRLMHDSEDLIHKATGWMLREIGKRDKEKMMRFLTKHKKEMARTALRYACEHLSATEKALIL